MPNVTVICYLSSLLSYGMGFSKVFFLKNVVTEPVTTYDYNIHVSLATGYFVLAIFFAVVGFIFFCVKNNRKQETIEIISWNSEEMLVENQM